MELIRDTLLIKKDFIERDELDVGPRRLLNFGHTFGHAYESATNYQIPHGVAVAIGMCNAAFVSQKLGMLPEQKFELIWSTLEPLTKKFHSQLFAIDMKTIASAIQRDKKNTSNKINCILLSGLGNLEIRPLSLNEDVLPLIEGFLSWIKAQDNQSRSLR
jgi:3-dehydroquinate synthase